MNISITINLPENLVESAQRLGEATARKLSDVLVDTLEIVLPVSCDSRKRQFGEKLRKKFS